MSEDYLKQFINKSEGNKEEIEDITNKNIQIIGDNIRQKVDYIPTDIESQWQNIDIEHLPFRNYYEIGTKIFIRAAKTKEIEAFSTINESNHYDVHLKITQLLKSCVKVTMLNGTIGSYKDIMYGDRDILIMLISHLTSKSGKKLSKKITCTCGTENNIDYIPANIKFRDVNEKIKKYLDQNTKVYNFTLKNGYVVKLKPPTIGLVESLNEYIFYNTMLSQKESVDGKITYVPNVSFMENIVYLKSGLGVKELDIKGWEQEEFEYERMNDDIFMFIDDAVKLISDGIEKIEKPCSSEICTKNVSTPFHFPDGVRALFIVPNAFDEFIA